MEKRFVTSNGVDIFSYPNNNLHSFYIALYAKAGVLYEPRDKAGLTHALEHCVFRNIKRLKNGELYRLLDSYGLSMNAATCKEFVQFTISGAAENFEIAADIISLVFEPVDISLYDFKTELSRIRSEIREEGEKTSVGGISCKKVWEGTNLENSISGNGKSLSRINRKALKDWQKEIFSNGNMFFYLTGNVTQQNIEYLAGITEKYSFCKAEKKNNMAFAGKDFFARDNCYIFKNSDYCKVMLNFDLDCSSISFEVRHILYSMLFDGESSLIFGGLSEDSGIIYSYDCCIEEYKNIGCFRFSYDVKQSNLYKSLEIVTGILNKLKKEQSGVFKLAKVPYTVNASLVLDSPFDLNWDRAFESHILNMPYKSISDKSKSFSSVTHTEIQMSAEKLFTTKNLVAVIKADLKKLDTARVKEIFSCLNVTKG